MRIREPLEMSRGVSFRNFAALAKLRGWTTRSLSDQFKTIGGELFFKRVLDGDPSGLVVIPYRAVVVSYLTAASELIAAQRLRACKCGCGSPVFGHELFAWDDCPERPKRGPLEPRRGVEVVKAGVVAETQGAALKPLLAEGLQGADFASDMASSGAMAS